MVINHSVSNRELLTKDQLAIGEMTRQRAAELDNAYQEKNVPEPLQRQVPSPEPFPFDDLGAVLGNAARRIHEIVKAPDAICGQSVLAAAALVAQPYIDIQIDGRVRPLSLYFLTVAESGDRKSAVDDIALKPVRDYEKMLYRSFVNEKVKYRNDRDLWERERKAILGEYKSDDASDKLKKMSKEPIQPLDPYILLEEPTYEGLVKLLATGRPSVGLFSDEGGRVFGGHAMNAENMLKTICGLSTLWDGKPITRTRRGDENLLLFGRRFSAHLMIQEVVLSKLLDNILFTQQGMLARCLTVMPETTAGNRPYNAVDFSEDPAIKLYWDHVNGLLDQPFPLENPDITNELSPRSITLSDGAKKVWVEFHDEIDGSLTKDGPYHGIRRFANKAAEQALRIAGVLTYFHDPAASVIGDDEVGQAISLCQYYLREAVRISEIGFSDPNLELAQKVLDWMVNQARSEGMDKVFTLQEMYQSAGPRGVRIKKMAVKILGILESHHLVLRHTESGTEWRLNELIFC